MSIGADLQTLNSGNSPYVELFEIQVAESTYIYITNYLEDIGPFTDTSTNLIQFRDYDNPSVIRTYYPVPSSLEGIEHKSEGQFPQPTLTIANILRSSGNDSFSGLLGSLSYEDILGFKVIRRRTLKKYLHGESGDANPPVELPRDVFYLDRIEDETPDRVVFTTVLPIDFTGVTLPKRNIIGNRCPWVYQGASRNKNEWEKVGGCNWMENSSIIIGDNYAYVYVNEDDEYLIDSTTTFTLYSSGSVDRFSFYKVVKSGLTKISETGTLSTATDYDYWQNLTGVDTTPSDLSPNWRRVRIYTEFTGSPTVNVYTNSSYNSYFRTGTTPDYTIWKAVSRSQQSAAAPTETGVLWERGDKCGKRIDSCKARFEALTIVTLAVAATTNLNVGNTILGDTSESSARVEKISGTTLHLTGCTGDFISGETIRSNDNDSTPEYVSTAQGAIVKTPGFLDNFAPRVLPFGSFPTARVFQ